MTGIPDTCDGELSPTAPAGQPVSLPFPEKHVIPSKGSGIASMLVMTHESVGSVTVALAGRLARLDYTSQLALPPQLVIIGRRPGDDALS